MAIPATEYEETPPGQTSTGQGKDENMEINEATRTT